MKKRGFVFVSYSQKDRERIRPLVELLDGALRRVGSSIVWDVHLRAGVNLNNEIYKLVRDAACVLVVWSRNSVAADWVQGECEQARKDGRLAAVRIDANAAIRPPFNVQNALDLSSWRKGKTPAVEQLLGSVLGLVKLGARAVDSPLLEATWQVKEAYDAAEELARLAGSFAALGAVVSADSPVVVDLRASLDEVAKTVRVVRRAVKEFLKPALRKRLDADAFVKIAYGDVVDTIEAGRGHCGLILVHYRRHGGIRDAVAEWLDAAKLRKLDATFERLGTADGDLFKQLARIGTCLEDESRVIVNLVLSGREEDARKHVADARALLQPFERKLSAARARMSELRASLGVR